MVTAEIAVALPALVLVLTLALGAVAVVTDHLRCVDAARVGARLLARGEDASRVRVEVARQAPDGADIGLDVGIDSITVEVTAARRPCSGPWASALALEVSPTPSPRQRHDVAIRASPSSLCSCVTPTDRWRERGSGTVLAVAAIGVLLVLTTAGLQLGAAATAAHRARTAADLSALAGATPSRTAGSMPVPGRQLSRGATSAQIIQCSLGVGESVSVRVSTPVATRWPGVPDRAVASARAGPADTAPQ